jgi:hypothetical protein
MLSSAATKLCESPTVIVRPAGCGWEVVGLILGADGEALRRTLDVYATERLANNAAAQLLARLRRYHPAGAR